MNARCFRSKVNNMTLIFRNAAFKLFTIIFTIQFKGLSVGAEKLKLPRLLIHLSPLAAIFVYCSFYHYFNFSSHANVLIEIFLWHSVKVTLQTWCGVPILGINAVASIFLKLKVRKYVREIIVIVAGLVKEWSLAGSNTWTCNVC